MNASKKIRAHKESKYVEENCTNPGTGTEENLQQTNRARVRVLTPKTNKECTKAFQKIRQRRNDIQDHKNHSMVQINQQEIAHDALKAHRKIQ